MRFIYAYLCFFPTVITGDISDTDDDSDVVGIDDSASDDDSSYSEAATHFPENVDSISEAMQHVSLSAEINGNHIVDKPNELNDNVNNNSSNRLDVFNSNLQHQSSKSDLNLVKDRKTSKGKAFSFDSLIRKKSFESAKRISTVSDPGYSSDYVKPKKALERKKAIREPKLNRSDQVDESNKSSRSDRRLVYKFEMHDPVLRIEIENQT